MAAITEGAGARNLAERLAEYASSLRFSDLDQRTIFEAKVRILDSLGCAIGAFRERPVRAARRLALGYPDGATILGTRRRTSPEMATLVNGLMVRYFDYNDTYLSKEPGHPSDNIPACLAAAESEGRTGRDILLAVCLAYEVQCRLCDAASLRQKGWDHVCYGLVSSALGAGRLLGLSEEELVQAVNISLNSHIAMRQVRAGELSEWKGFSFANASRNALFSALLAREGVTGPSPIFEGEMGFFKQVSGPFDLDVVTFGKRGGGFRLPETYVKYFPAEYHSQSAIWAALEARSEAGGDLREVTSVEVETHEAGYTILGKDREKWAPATRETADHSLPYIVGMALLEGRVDNRTYAARRMRDPKVLSFLRKVAVTEDPELTAMYPDHIANRVTLRFRNGRVVTSQVDDPKGHPRNPMTTDEVRQKFRSLTKGSLTEARGDAVAEFVMDLERKRDISALLRLCVVRRG